MRSRYSSPRPLVDSPWVRGVSSSTCALLLVLSCCLPCHGTNAFDRAGYDLVHDTYRSPLLDRTMETVTRAADRQTLLASALLIATLDRSHGPETARLLSASLAAGQLAASIGKLASNRSRPDGSHSPRSNSSFPSGHATAAFGMAPILADRYGISSPLLYSGASMVAVSRVYLGRHYPSDVVAGALIGYGCGRLALHFRDRIIAIRVGHNRRELGIHLTTTSFFVSLQAVTNLKQGAQLCK